MKVDHTNSLAGIWTALITPFDKQGQIDWKAYENLLKEQEEAGVRGVVICGTTGEAPTLSVQEKLALIKKAKAILNDSTEIMAGTGSNNTNQTIELSRLAIDAGAKHLLIVTPPYNKPTLAGLKLHYEAIAKEVSANICLYHVPGRTAQCLSEEAITALCAIPKITSVKEASGDMMLFSKANNSSDVEFLSGDDGTYLPSLSLGGKGAISVVSNVFPKAMVELTKSFESGDNKRALAIHKALLPMIEALFCETNPAPTKAVLSMEGKCLNTLRLPLTTVTDSSLKRIEETYQQTTSQLKDLGI